jgi:hypothetical protein
MFGARAREAAVNLVELHKEVSDFHMAFGPTQHRPDETAAAASPSTTDREPQGVDGAPGSFLEEGGDDVADDSSREETLWERIVLEDAHSREVLRVVRYGSSPPVLEKRHFFIDGKTQLWRTGKVKGLTGLDLALVLDRLEEFQDELLEPWKARVRAKHAHERQGTGPLELSNGEEQTKT